MTGDPIDWLHGLAQFGIKFGLQNIRAVLGALGHPEHHFRALHVAGTNGKGSVTAIVEAALRSAGYRTGRYTSPHLLDLTERFVVNGTAVHQADMVAAVESVRAAVGRLQADGTLDVHPTFFEVTTAVAFELFRRHHVEVAVCEVGLGGRLDATNVLSPVACAITSIAFDHEQYLGHTLREIATEKAGIIKPSVPVVIGTMAPEAEQAIAEVAHRQEAPLVRAMDGAHLGSAATGSDHQQQFALRTRAHDYGQVTFALAGPHQIANALVAVTLIEQAAERGMPVGADAILHALATVRWPGRLEHVTLADGTKVLLDAAHNPAGAEALAAYLRTLSPPRALVFSAMRDKDLPAILRPLASVVSRIVITRATNPRAADPPDIAALVRALAPALPVEVVEPPQAAVIHAAGGDMPVVVAGSIFLLADVMKMARRS